MRQLKIWISRIDKIGDLVVSIPCFAKLRLMYPEAYIAALVSPYNADIVRYLPYLSEVIEVQEENLGALVQKAQEEQLSIFIALDSHWMTAFLAYRSKADVRICNYSKWYSFLCFNKGLRQKRSESLKHETEYSLELIRQLNPALYDSQQSWHPWIFPDEASKQAAYQFYQTHQLTSPIILHPFNGGSVENLHSENYISLLKALRAQTSKQILLIGQKQEEEALQALAQKADITDLFIYANEGSILKLAVIIGGASVFIGTSTGPLHIANSAGRKIVALFPCNLPQTSVKRWGLLHNPNVKYIFPDAEKRSENKKRSAYFATYNSVIEQEIVLATLTLLQVN